jgi:TPR repeat protein
VSAARRLYERAAGSSGAAATALGKTYDPAFLAGISSVGITADPAVAETWYRRALALGDNEAQQWLNKLGAKASR